MNKRRMILLFFLAILTGCTQVNPNPTKTAEKEEFKYYSYLDNINNKVIDKAGIIADYIYDTSDPAEQMRATDFTVLATVDSLDGADVYNDHNLVYTYGKITVLKIYKGDLEAGSTYEFKRGGGLMNKRNYYTKIGEEEIYIKDKEEHNKTVSDEQLFIELVINGGPQIDKGRTYLLSGFYDEDGNLSLESHEFSLNEIVDSDGKTGFREIPDTNTLNIKSIFKEEIEPLNSFEEKYLN